MHTRSQKSLLLWFCIPAALFLAEPNVAFRDLLPDCIGYILLCAGLSRVAQLNDYIADALASFKKMLWISVGAMLAEYYLQNILPTEEEALNAYESPTLLLLFSFVIFVLKCYFLLPAYRDLFLGFGSFAERHGGDRIQEKRRGKTRTERMSLSTRRFVVVSSVLSLLPELAVLGSFEYEVENTPVDWFRFVELFRTVAFAVSLVVSVLWLIRAVRYWSAMLSDRPMMEALEARYAEESLPNAPMLAWHRYRFAFWFLMVGVVFSIGLRMDERAIFPSVLCAMLCSVGVFWTGEAKGRHHRVWILITAALCALCSIASEILNSTYFKLYLSAEASYYSTNAYRLFLAVRILQIGEAIFTFVFLLFVLRWLYAFVKERACISYGADDVEVSVRATERLHRGFKRRIILSAVLFFLSAAGQAAERLLCLTYPWLWWISVSVSLSAVIAFVALLFAILDHFEQQALSERQMHKV